MFLRVCKQIVLSFVVCSGLTATCGNESTPLQQAFDVLWGSPGVPAQVSEENTCVMDENDSHFLKVFLHIEDTQLDNLELAILQEISVMTCSQTTTTQTQHSSEWLEMTPEQTTYIAVEMPVETEVIGEDKEIHHTITLISKAPYTTANGSLGTTLIVTIVEDDGDQHDWKLSLFFHNGLGYAFGSIYDCAKNDEVFRNKLFTEHELIRDSKLRENLEDSQ